MNRAETEEHRTIRDAVGAITDNSGHRTSRSAARRGAAHEPTSELWQAMADGGFIGINLPEEHGGAARG